MKFDQRGLLFPYELTPCSLLDFEVVFVQNLEKKEVRQALFEWYHLFSETRRNRIGKRHKKGIIKITIS